MKRILYLAVVLGIALGNGSCSQDLGQNPPFNYPPEETPGGGDGDEGEGGDGGDEGTPLPMPENCILRMTFEENLDIESSYEGMAANFYAKDGTYGQGHNGKAYQGAEGQAIVITSTPDELKSLGSFTLTMWIKYDGSNANACNLFAIAHPSLAVANLSLFLNNGADNGETFFFKGYFNGTAEKWFDKGDEAKVTSGIKNQWTQVGFVYDAATSTASLYHDGTLMTSAVLEDFGALSFEEISGIAVGAFPSMVGLSSATSEWPASGSWYTGLMDDLYLYDVALTDTEMAAQYQEQL